jgi:hypothetical protein
MIQEKLHEDAIYGNRRTNVVRNTRQLVAKSVSLLGSVVGSFGESIVATGAAAESLASATAGLAEDTLRIVEDLTGSLSTTLQTNKKHRVRLRRIPKGSGVASEKSPTNHEKEEPASFLLFGTHPGADTEPSLSATYMSSLMVALEGFQTKPNVEAVETIAGILTDQFLSLIAFLQEDTEGIPSLAPELFMLLLICFLASMLLLSSKARRGERDQPRNVPIKTIHLLSHHSRPSSFSETLSFPDESSSADSPLGRSVVEKRGYSTNAAKSRWRSLSSRLAACILLVGTWFLKLVCIPIWLLRRSLWIIYSIIFNRITALLAIYAFSWLYLSRASQFKALSIER